ncbi:MAG: Xaa-Pro peptidase family protein, partial [Planctomycetota bacterium]|nr:Xaa-Pro peptidase family protein [Planctomycetota bacterium]
MFASSRLTPTFIAVALAAIPSMLVSQQLPEDGRGQGLLNMEWHAARRAQLMEEVGRGIIVLRGAPTLDDYREFRQDNNFWYLTGITTPNAALILIPEAKEVFLLVPPVDPRMETWMGDLIDPKEAQALTGIKRCLPTGKMSRSGNWDGLEKAIRKALLLATEKIIYVQEMPSENWMMSRDNLLTAARSQAVDPFDGRNTRERQFKEKLKEVFEEVEVKDITTLLDALRIYKTPEEVEAMRRACEISGAAHTNIMKSAQLGDYEWQMAAQMTGDFYSAGAMGPGYMAIVGTGPNSCTLHYSANNRKLTDGDIVMIDYGAEYNHYVADVSRTWPAGEKFTERQAEIYQAVYDAQEAAFKECKPGSNLRNVHRAAYLVLKERGFAEAFPHGTSHWLGMATHDV